jgi:hypothetical protein
MGPGVFYLAKFDQLAKGFFFPSKMAKKVFFFKLI